MGPISHPRLQDGTAAATKGASVRGAAKKLVLFVIWSAGGDARPASAVGILVPPSHPFGRDDIGNGQKEGEGRGTAEGEKTEGSRGSRGGERTREGRPFSYRRPFLCRSGAGGRSLRLPLRSLHCFSPE